MDNNFDTPRRSLKFYWQLFYSTFLISAFTVGGGFVIIPLLKAKYVDEYKWIDEKEALDLVSIGQSMPGVVAVNTGIILGYRMAGLAGSLTALLATILPPLIIISIIATCYDAFKENAYVKLMLKGMQAGATAIIVKVAIDLLKKEMKRRYLLPLLITLLTFIGNVFFDVNIIILIIVDAIIGLMFLRDKKYG